MTQTNHDFGKFRKRLIALNVFVMVTLLGFGQTTFTSNGAGTTWTTTSNWSCGGCGLYPGQSSTTDIVVINNNINFTSGGSNITVASITINNATLTVGGNNILTAGSIDINSTGTGAGDLTIWAQGTGSPTVNVTNDITITRNSTSTNATRLRIGSNGTFVTNSTVTIGRNLIYNYNTGANESNVEISVGNSATQNDACNLVVNGSINAVYNFANDATSDYLELRVANSSTVQAGNISVTSGSGATNSRSLITLTGSTTLVDASAGVLSVSNRGVLTVSGAASTSGKLKAKSIDINNGSLSVNGNSTTMLEVSNPAATAITINGTSSESEMLIYEDAKASVTGNVSIIRNLPTTDNVRLRVGGSSTLLSTSTVTITGDLAFTYLNSSPTSSETINEISVGNSSGFSDQCQLNITGDVLLVYNYNGSQNSNVLSFEVGKASSVSMNNLNMLMTEGGSGVGCDIRLATNDNLGASITINGNATLQFDDSSPNVSADVYIKAGNDATTASTTVTIKGNLSMTSNYQASGTNNTYLRASGTSVVNVEGSMNFTASAASGASVENRVTLYDNSVLNLSGAIGNPLQGSFDFVPNASANATIKFIGSVPQNFPARFGSTSTHFKNVVVNNTSGVSFSIPTSTMNIDGNLTMTSGVINSSSANKLVFEDGATCNGGSTSSYITGLIQKNGGTINNAIAFPSGSGTHWAPIEISNIVGANATTVYLVEYFPTAYSVLTTDGTFSGVSDREYWNVSVTGTIPVADVTLYWKDACFSNVSAGSPLHMARFGGTTWTDLTNSVASGTTTCSGGTGSVTSTGVNAFNNFTFSFAGTVLPIELMSFQAEPVNQNFVRLFWETASEIRNDHFVVSRSSDLKTFQTVGVIPSLGDSHEPRLYEMVDSTARLGINYYRLSQVDISGDVETFKIISVRMDHLESVAELYPNPVFEKDGGVITIVNRDYEEKAVKLLRIFSPGGSDVTAKCQIDSSQNKFRINVLNLNSGVYLIQFLLGTTPHTLKFILN